MTEAYKLGDFSIENVLIDDQHGGCYYTQVRRLVEVKTGLFRKKTVRKWVLVGSQWAGVTGIFHESHLPWAEELIRKVRALDIEAPEEETVS